MSDEAFKARAAARKAWPIRRYRLGKEPDDGVLNDIASVNARLAMMWPLALDAWASSGRPLPEYERSTAPGVVIRKPHG